MPKAANYHTHKGVYMNKVDLTNAIATKTGLTKKDCSAAVDAFFEAITEALTNGEKIQIIGFGTFELKHREKRTGRNPRTGEELIIPAVNAVVFKAGKTLKDVVNGVNEEE
jgi:DNA-binding protein HU-beta